MGVYFGDTRIGRIMAGVPTSSGGGEASYKDVNFIDYDGTMLHSYTAAEFNTLGGMPDNPVHEGLTSQGWNWTRAQILDQLAAQPGAPVWVGQMYITTSGATEIDIELDKYLEPYLMVCPKGTLSIDWGDGSTLDTVTGTSLTSNKYVGHTYAVAGKYTIKISVDSGSFTFVQGSSNYAGLFSDHAGYTRGMKYSISAIAVRLGSSITTLGSCSFINCYSLSSITIPDSVTVMSNDVFYNCYSLSSITIPDGVTSISANLFQNCYALSSITIPDGVTSIDGYAFQNCYSLNSITIPDGVTSIGNNAFQYCFPLTSITIPDGVTSIGSSAFNNCYLLTDIKIPDGVTSLENSAFSSCRKLSEVVIPDGVTSLGNSAFHSCFSLKSLTIPDSVTTLGTNTFQYCYALPELNLPDTITAIPNSMCYGCYSLTHFTIPAGVTSIGTQAFYQCYLMHEFHFLPTTPPTLAATSAFSSVPSDCVFYVPAASLEAYKSATNWSTYASRMVGE